MSIELTPWAPVYPISTVPHILRSMDVLLRGLGILLFHGGLELLLLGLGLGRPLLLLLHRLLQGSDRMLFRQNNRANNYAEYWAEQY